MYEDNLQGFWYKLTLDVLTCRYNQPSDSNMNISNKFVFVTE